jgi:hypothetical protein
MLSLARRGIDDALVLNDPIMHRIGINVTTHEPEAIRLVAEFELQRRMPWIGLQ